MSGMLFPSCRMSIDTSKVKERKYEILGQLTFLHNENFTSVVCEPAAKDELGSMLASSAGQVELVSM